jgi:hypothetical protein
LQQEFRRINSTGAVEYFLKNIENKAVSNLLHLYNAGTKQCFIAIDEIGKYGDASAAMLRKQAVIQLDDDNVLYVRETGAGASLSPGRGYGRDLH